MRNVKILKKIMKKLYRNADLNLVFAVTVFISLFVIILWDVLKNLSCRVKRTLVICLRALMVTVKSA